MCIHVYVHICTIRIRVYAPPIICTIRVYRYTYSMCICKYMCAVGRKQQKTLYIDTAYHRTIPIHAYSSFHTHIRLFPRTYTSLFTYIYVSFHTCILSSVPYVYVYMHSMCTCKYMCAVGRPQRKRRICMWKESYTCTCKYMCIVRVNTRVQYEDRNKRGVYICEKRHIYMCKETYIYVKRDIYICEKRHIYMWKETYIYVKRGVYICEQRHIYMWKEAYIYVERDVCNGRKRVLCICFEKHKYTF